MQLLSYPNPRNNRIGSFTSAGSILRSHDLVNANANGGAFALAPPTGIPAGHSARVRKTDATFNAVTITGITTLNTQNETVLLVYDGSSWIVFERYIPTVPVAYTPSGSWSTNTTYTGFWWRTGAMLNLDVNVALAGAPDTAALTFNIPSGLAIDTAKRTNVTGTAAAQLGLAAVFDNSAITRYLGFARYNNTTSIAVYYDSGNGTGSQPPMNQAQPMTFAASDFVNAIVTGIPISGWNG